MCYLLFAMRCLLFVCYVVVVYLMVVGVLALSWLLQAVSCLFVCLFVDGC